MASVPPEFIDSAKDEASRIGYTEGSPEALAYVIKAIEEYKEERRKDAEYQRELGRIQAQPRSQTPSSITSTSSHHHKAVPRPLPYDPAKGEQLDHFFHRYEQYCELMELDSRASAIGVSNLLPSELSIILESLSLQDRTNYAAMKTALLKAAQFTPEGYRKRFLETKPQSHENFSRYLSRMKLYLDEWLQASGVPKTYDGVANFLVLDSILNEMPPTFKAHMRERFVFDTGAMGTIGDSYLDIHYPDHNFPLVYNRQQEKRNKSDHRPGVFGGLESNRKQGKVTTLGSSAPQRPSATNPRFPHQMFKPTAPNQSGNQYHRSNLASSPAAPGNPAIKSPYCTFHKTSGHSSEQCRASKQRNSSSGLGHLDCYGEYELDEDTREEEPHGAEEEQSSTEPTPEPEDSGNSAQSEDLGPPFMGPSLAALSSEQSVLTRCEGHLDGQPVTVLLDSGADGLFVDRKLVQDSQLTGKYARVKQAEGPPLTRPYCTVRLDCPYFNGSYNAVALNNPSNQVFLGEIKGSKPFPGTKAAIEAEKTLLEALPLPPEPISTQDGSEQIQEDSYHSDVTVAHVETRHQKRTNDQAQHVPIEDEVPTDLLQNRDQFLEDQKNCPDLQPYHVLAKQKKEKLDKRHKTTTSFFYTNGLLYLKKIVKGVESTRLCIPKKHRKQVLYLGHHNPLSGHRGINKTQQRISRHFTWPGCEDDIKRYVRSCHVCQLTDQKRTSKAPMGITKLSSEPFSQVSIDIVGPINPASSSGNKYILTYVDCATRYADAVALKNIESATVAEALFAICSRVGFPATLTSDNGTNFTSHTFQAFLQLLRVRHIKTSVYHAQSNGITERFNGTLKRCLRRLAIEDPKAWDKCLPALFFAYRDSIHSSTGYSPFELIYGHKVRGPLEFLKECWESEIIDPEDLDVHQYILQMRYRLKDTCRLAHEMLRSSQEKNKAIFDRKAKRRVLRPGDQVLLLLPTDTRKLLLTWKGPFVITKRYDADHYCLNVFGKEKMYHINQVKLYHPPHSDHSDPSLAPHTNPAVYVSHRDSSNIPLENQEDSEVDYDDPSEPHNLERHLHLGTALATEDIDPSTSDGYDVGIPTNSEETYRDCLIAPELSLKQQQDIFALLGLHKNILTDLPGRTPTLEHKIELSSTVPLRHTYPIPQSLSNQLKCDLEKWTEMGIVESSNSPYCSPLLAVRKSDGTHRFCLDCRSINAITQFDGEPIADPQEIFLHLKSAKFLSKMDLSSGYWQVPLSIESKPYTAFSTRYGHYQFKVMPFGLNTAPATFSRLMRIVTKGLDDVHAYMDDILIASKTWESHVSAIEAILNRLERHGLHVKPSKCMFGFTKLEYLGHLVGEGQYTPLENKLHAIEGLPLPQSKKQLRSFLGSTGYYQKFVRHYTDIAAPLFDMLKSKSATNLQWTETAKSSFQQLKKALTQQPVLQLPSPNLPYTLQTDASDNGIGAVLLQPANDDPRRLAPVVYASRRLKSAERNYSVIEREALAVYWAVRKFEVYLYGRVFNLSTDHKPLLHLQSADKLNPRLKRWALYLNMFKYYSSHVPGSENCLSDLLSRSPTEDLSSDQDLLCGGVL